MTTLDSKGFQGELRRLDGLLREAKRFADPAVQAHCRALVQAVLALHGAGLERILAHLDEAGEVGRAVLDACADDEVVGGLLLLHNLHPLDLEARVSQALDQVRPMLRGHGAEVDLLGVRDGVVRLRVHGGGDGCGSSSAALRQAVEEAVVGRAPDATAVEVEIEAGRAAENGRVPLPLL